MVFELLKLNIEVADEHFNLIYPEPIRLLARKHWTPVNVAKMASEYLAEKPGARVLDIGSGAGKFCLIGATHTNGYFTGVEQRFKLVELSRMVAKSYSIPHVNFINCNIDEIEFRKFDSFYFFNSFYENMDIANRIDDQILLDTRLYHRYSVYLFNQFSTLPLGARLVTYCSPISVIPSCFKQQYSLVGGLLRFWEKIQEDEIFE